MTLDSVSALHSGMLCNSDTNPALTTISTTIYRGCVLDFASRGIVVPEAEAEAKPILLHCGLAAIRSRLVMLLAWIHKLFDRIGTSQRLCHCFKLLA